MRWSIKKASNNKQVSGFTIIELIIVILIIGIVGTLILSTFASISRNNRNQERERDIQAVYQALEAYYVVNSKYPTLANMNDLNWVRTNMKTLNIQALRDPRSGSYKLAAKPASDIYVYDVRSSSGGYCDDIKTTCAHYTLTATLEKSADKTYVKSSLN